MSRYSSERKAWVIEQLNAPNPKSVKYLAEATGIPVGTIRSWSRSVAASDASGQKVATPAAAPDAAGIRHGVPKAGRRSGRTTRRKTAPRTSPEAADSVVLPVHVPAASPVPEVAGGPKPRRKSPAVSRAVADVASAGAHAAAVARANADDSATRKNPPIADIAASTDAESSGAQAADGIDRAEVAAIPEQPPMRAQLPGMYFLRVPAGVKYRKVLVSGLGRSGTSAVASLLHHSGFYLSQGGSGSSNTVYEDPKLRKMMLTGKPKQLLKRLLELQGKHERFAWKEPKLLSPQGNNALSLLDDGWLLLVIFRDPVANALRRIRSDNVDFADALRMVTKAQVNMTKSLESLKGPIAFLSYEQFVADPVSVITNLLSVLDASVPQHDEMHRLVDRLFEDKKAYQKKFD